LGVYPTPRSGKKTFFEALLCRVSAFFGMLHPKKKGSFDKGPLKWKPCLEVQNQVALIKVPGWIRIWKKCNCPNGFQPSWNLKKKERLRS